MKVFISYGRSDASIASEVADDVRRLGHTPWIDQQIRGGQLWWSAILQGIRECDVFLYIQTQRWVDSKACRSEFRYAKSLQKHCVPLQCSQLGVLPPELSVTHY